MKMVKTARARLGLTAALCLALIAAGFLIARPKLLDERVIRITLVDALSEWTGAKVTLSAPAHIQYFPRLLVKTGPVHLNGISSLPSIRRIDAKHATLRLGLWSLVSGAPVIDRVTLEEPVVEATAITTEETSHDEEAAQSLVSAITNAPVAEFHFDNGTINVSGPNATETFEKVNGKVELEQDGYHLARGSLEWRGQTISFNYSGGAPQPSADLVRLPVTLSLNSDFLTANVEGQATHGHDVRVDGELKLRISDVSRFARWTGVLVPEDEVERSFTADGHFNWSGHRIGFDEGTFYLDGNKALGALSLEFGEARPKIDGTLALQRLDVTPYLTRKIPPKQEKSQSADAPKSYRPAIDLDFPILHHVNFDLRISTTDLKAGTLSFGQSALAVTLNAGKLAADLAVFDFCGGAANSRLELDATVPESALKVTSALNGIALRPCVETFNLVSPVDGMADVSVDATSSGRSADELIDNLRGKTSVAVSAGTVRTNFAGLLTKVESGPLTGWSALEQGTTAFTLLKATVFLRHRAIYTDSLKADLGGGIVTGEAGIDFAKQLIDVKLDFAEKSASEPATADKPAEKLDVIRPKRRIAIKGPWSKPTFSAGEEKSTTNGPSVPVRVRTGWQRN